MSFPYSYTYITYLIVTDKKTVLDTILLSNQFAILNLKKRKKKTIKRRTNFITFFTYRCGIAVAML